MALDAARLGPPHELALVVVAAAHLMRARRRHDGHVASDARGDNGIKQSDAKGVGAEKEEAIMHGGGERGDGCRRRVQPP